MSPDSWERIVAVAGPVSSLLVAGIFLFGAFYSRFRLAFSLIAIGAALLFVPQFFWLAMSLERTVGISLFSKHNFVAFFPVQALCSYLALAATLAGDAILVWQATRRGDIPNT